MRKLIVLLLALSLVACKRDLFPASHRSWASRNQLQPRPVISGTLPEGTLVWATAVVFPDSIDWRKETPPREDTHLLLLKNGVRADSIPSAGCWKPEQHRFQAGHLWTNRSDGYRTWIERDGAPYLSFEGEEALIGFLVHGGQVHTLGQYPGGGFCYREGGRPVYASASGLVLGSVTDPDWPGGALTADTEGVFFTYGVSQMSSDTPVWEYRLMRRDEIRKVITLPSGGKLFDVRVLNGECYRLEYRFGQYCLIESENSEPLSLSGEQSGLRLLLTDGEIMASGTSRQGRISRGWLEGMGGRSYQFTSSKYTVSYFSVRGGQQVAVLLDGEDSVVQMQIGRIGNVFPSGRYRLQNDRCAAFRDGVLAVALTAADGDEHLLVVNGDEQTVHFNGYFTGVYIE